MKTKYFYLAALAGLTLASCSSDDFIAEAPPVEVENPTQVPIMFSSLKSNFTRAGKDITGKSAADSLGGKFVVVGFKGSTTTTPGSIVFDNYLVEYADNTAHTTESNSNNWEYVGKGPTAHATTNGITQQTIKYWDYSASQYDFIAWGMGKYDGTNSIVADYGGTGDVANHHVRVSAISPNGKSNGWPASITEGVAPNQVTYDRPAYTFEGKAADLAHCYISDIVTVLKGTTTSTTKYGVVENGYQDAVTLKFRQLGTKVRIGIYETVPGYSVKNVKFYTKGGLLTKTGDVLDEGQIVDNATIYSEGADIYTEGTYTVYFPTVDQPNNADNNQAHIKFAPKTGVTQATVVDWGGMNYTIRESGEHNTNPVYLGRSSNAASFAGNPDNNYYEFYLPNESGTNLNLRVNYTLESIDGSGETIEVKNAKAQVPSIYTTWKPGYAYTYLFKISDKTNGWTGVYDPTQGDNATVNSDPVGLYPITFDAVVVNAEEDATQETITTVSTPSITTYQQNSTVVNADEYTVNGKDIFVTVNDNETGGTNNLVTMTASGDGQGSLYTIEAGHTEAEVIDALSYQDEDLATNAAAGTIKGRSGLVLTPATFTLTNSVEFGANGNAISVGTDQALRFTPTANTTYAFVYTKTAAAGNAEEKYGVINFSTFTGAKYRYAYKGATPSYDDTDDTKDVYDAQKGIIYFSRTGDATSGYVYEKVGNPFIGQGVSNLYLNNGTTIAKGYAVTGTNYYYTKDDGKTYIQAVNVKYEDFGTSLFVWDASEGKYKNTTDTTPQDGTAYYSRSGTEGSYVYTYCVILPQQTNNWFELDTENYEAATESTAVEGQTYFDKYTKNNGVYYSKIIKVAPAN